MLALYLTMLSDERDKTKFSSVYYKYRYLMANRAFDILRDKGLAEDAVQDAFLRILKNLAAVGEVDSARTRNFVVIVTENCAKDIYRREHRAEVVELTDDAGEYFVTEDNLAVEEIKRQIAALPEIYSDTLSLKFFNELSDKEIASALSVSVSTVRKRLLKGREMLKTALKEAV